MGPHPVTIDPRALDLIKEFEGLRLETYYDSVGVPTIGFGTTAAASVGIAPKAGMRITREQAEVFLLRAVERFADQIRPAMIRTPTPAQFGAMVSLAYNIGPTAFRRSSVLRLFNAGDMVGSADAFRLWNKAGGRVLNGLVRRREAERALFLSDEPPAAEPAPSTVPDAPTGILATILATIFRRKS